MTTTPSIDRAAEVEALVAAYANLTPHTVVTFDDGESAHVRTSMKNQKGEVVFYFPAQGLSDQIECMKRLTLEACIKFQKSPLLPTDYPQ